MDENKTTLLAKIVKAFLYTLLMVIVSMQGIFTLVNLVFTNMSKLETNTEIYNVEHREDIVLAKVVNQFIPYLKYIEV